MFKKFLLTLALSLLPAIASAQTCPTRPAGDSSNACASTAFVQNTIVAGVPYTDISGLPANTFLGNNTGSTGNAIGMSVAQSLALMTSTSGGGTANFLRADGTWALPGGFFSADKIVYVSTSGNDSNSGLNPSAAKLTLQAAENAANPGGIVYVGAGTYTLTTTYAKQPGVTTWCPQGATITQGTSQNLTNLIDFAANSANNARIYGCTVDGNRANNTLNLANNVVNIGSANNVIIDGASVIQNGTGMGINITTGTGFRIRNNTIQNNVYAGIYAVPRSLVFSNGEIASNQILQIDGHGIIFDGSSFNKIHDNYLSGTMISNLTVNVSGTTITVTGGGTPFSNTCSSTTICPGQFVISLSGSINQENFITSITSSTVATANVAGTTVTGATAVGGSGDMIGVAATSSTNDFYNNTLLNGTGGFVESDEGDAGDFGTHTFNSYRGNYVQGFAGNCFSIQGSNASYSIVYTSYVGNKAQNCLFANGATIYNFTEGTAGAFTFFGPNVSRIFVDGNSAYDTQGTPTIPYWLTVGTGVGQGGVAVGKNASQVINGGIFNAITSIALSAGWGSTASTSAISSDGDSFQFTVTASGTGQAANPTATIISRVAGATVNPQPICQNTTGSSNVSSILITSATVGSTVLAFFGTPTASATYTITCRL